MPTWLIILIIVIVIGGIIGLFVSGGEPSGCLFGALQGGLGCGGVLLQILFWGIAISLAIELFVWLFD